MYVTDLHLRTQRADVLELTDKASELEWYSADDVALVWQRCCFRYLYREWFALVVKDGAVEIYNILKCVWCVSWFC